MTVLGEEALQHGAHFGDMYRGDVPDDANVHVGVVVGHNVSHPPHSPKRKIGNLAPSCFGQVGRGLADDLDAPDDGISFLYIGAKTSSGRVFDVCRYETRGFQNVMQPAKLVSFHRCRPRWREYAHGQSDWMTSPETGVERNPRARPTAPPPHLRCRAMRRLRRGRSRQASPVNPHRCRVWPGHAKPNRKFLGDEYGAFRKAGATAAVVQPMKASFEYVTCQENTWSDLCWQVAHSMVTSGLIDRGTGAIARSSGTTSIPKEEGGR